MTESPQAESLAGRTAWGTLSRDEIIRAALRVVLDGGYPELSIRGLAGELGVAPMSLYRHIRDKDDLLDEVADRLLAEAWRPAAGADDWRAWLIEAASKLRALLVEQPAALHVYLRHPVVSPAAVERMTAMLRVLRRSGLSAEQAESAYGALHTYTIGFAALEASRARWTPPGAEGTLARRLAAYTSSWQFVEGLNYLLEGIAGHVGRDPG